MNASIDIRALATLGEQLLAALPTGDADLLEDAFFQYEQQFSRVQQLISERTPSQVEHRELARVAQVHAQIEAAVAQRRRATGEILSRLTDSRKLSGYAPVPVSARGPRSVDASA